MFCGFFFQSRPSVFVDYQEIVYSEIFTLLKGNENVTVL